MCKVSEVKKVPEIRFAGFAEPWEQRKLLDCIQKITDFRGRTPKKLGMDWSDSGYLALSALNVKDGYIDFSQDVHYGNQALYDKWMVGNELHEGQVLFTTEAPMGNVAQVPDNKRYILSQRTIAFDVRENVITENFLAAVLKSPAVFETLTALSSGGTAKGVSQKSLTAVDITLPRDLDEQSQLATVFSKINDLLTLYQRMLDRLVILKQAMLEKMFPKNGSNVPEVRFAGFTDPWEQRKVGDITIESSEYANLEAGYPLLTSSRAGLMYQNEYRGNLTTNSKETLFSVVPIGACTYRHMSDDDVFHLNVNALEKGLVSREYPVFFASEGTRLDFIVQYINSSVSFRAFCAEQKKGGTRTRLYYNALCEFKMMVPSQREQDAIADFFLKLDNLITFQQRKSESLKHIKAALLQKMFV